MLRNLLPRTDVTCKVPVVAEVRHQAYAMRSRKPTLCLDSEMGTALMLPVATGVMIPRQTGGTGCLRPSIEGIPLPLANDFSTKTQQLLGPCSER